MTLAYKRGDGDSPEAFCALVNLLLQNTVMEVGTTLHLQRGERRNNYVISGRLLSPIRLTNGRYLRIFYGLAIHGTKDGPRLKVINSGYQYQIDVDGKQWIFRYDYERHPARPHPPTHFHVRGKLAENCLPSAKTLEDIHFPASRVSLEAIIRLLIDQFKVNPITARSVWRPLLHESEQEFMEIAHRAASGPKR